MKSAFIHLPYNTVYQIVTRDNLFDEDVGNIAFKLNSKKDCWIPIISPEYSNSSTSYIYLTAAMTKKVFVRTVIH